MEPNTPIYPSSTNPTMANIEGPFSLLKYGWGMFKKNWKILVPIMIFPTLLMFIGDVAAMTGLNTLAIIGFIFSIAGIVFSIAMQPASVDTVRMLDTNPSAPLRFWQQYKVGFSLFWSFLLLLIIECLAVLGGFVILIIPGIIIAIYSGMYVFTRVIDGKKGFSALTESYLLIKGRWWVVLGRVLYMALIYIIASIIMAGVGYIINAIFGFTPMSIGGAIVTLILNLVLVAIMGSVAIAYMYKLYLSLKATKVGEVVTGTFKKWIIGFMVVGVLFIIASMTLFPALVLMRASKIGMQSQFNQSQNQ